jgi:hypothetical protein
VQAKRPEKTSRNKRLDAKGLASYNPRLASPSGIFYQPGVCSIKLGRVVFMKESLTWRLQ